MIERKEDFELEINEINYIVQNVPGLNITGEPCYSIDVSVKLEMILRLMMANEIPHIVNFDVVAGMRV